MQDPVAWLLGLFAIGWAVWIIMCWYRSCFLPQMLLGAHVRQHYDLVEAQSYEQIEDRLLLYVSRTQGYVAQVNRHRHDRFTLGLWSLVGLTPSLFMGSRLAPVMFILGLVPLLFVVVSAWIDVKIADLLQVTDQQLQPHLQRYRATRGTSSSLAE